MLFGCTSNSSLLRHKRQSLMFDGFFDRILLRYPQHVLLDQIVALRTCLVFLRRRQTNKIILEFFEFKSSAKFKQIEIQKLFC